MMGNQISLRSSSDLIEVIHSPSDAGETMRRAHQCLALYYDPDHDPTTKAEVRQAFGRALDGIPTWAMHRAFDRWEKTGQRRPSPAEIVILAEREMKPMADELARRQRIEAEDAAAEAERAKARVSPEAAARIMAEVGMTDQRLGALRRFPMAGSAAEAEAKAADWDKPTAHWSETAPPDDPRWEDLRKARAANPLVNGGR